MSRRANYFDRNMMMMKTMMIMNTMALEKQLKSDGYGWIGLSGEVRLNISAGEKPLLLFLLAVSVPF